MSTREQPLSGARSEAPEEDVTQEPEPTIDPAGAHTPRPRAAMLGPDAQGRGGAASVVAALQRAGSAYADIELIVTHRDGSVGLKVRTWLRGMRTLAWLLLGHRVDVIHAHVSERGSVLGEGLVVLLARRFRVPVLLHCHGAEFFDWYAGQRSGGRWLVRRVFGAAQRLGVESESAKRDYVRALGVSRERVVVLGQPVRLPELPPVRDEGVRALFLGRFGERKGSADVLAAAAGLPDDIRRQFSLRMAGEGAVQETVDLARDLAL
ncbi:MAG: glycosyltransferase, partial [Sciscionella sp.]